MSSKVYAGKSKRQFKKSVKKAHKGDPGGVKGYASRLPKDSSKLLRKVKNWLS